MRKQYSDAFIKQALIKVYSRGDRTIESVGKEVNAGYQTLKNCEKEIVASAQGQIRHPDAASSLLLK